MKNTRFISIFLITALIVSVFGFTSSAQATTGSCNVSVNVTGPHNAVVSVTNCFGDYDFKYWTGSIFRNIHYGNANGTSSLGLLNLLEGATYSYQIGSGSTGNFTTMGGNPSPTTTDSNNSTNNNSNNSGSSTVSPSVSTNGPASILSNSAVINGSINPNNSSSTFWFEFGTTNSFGQMTSVQSLGGGNSWQLVTGNLSSLQSGTTYYYRVAAQNSYGTNRGGILTFTTQGSQTGGQVLGSTSGTGTNGASGNGTGGATVSGSGSSSGLGTYKTTTKTATTSRTTTTPSNPVKDRPSFVSLEYSLGNEGALVLVADSLQPKPGEEFSYTIVYKNDTNATFSEANLKVILPVQVDYIGSDREPSNFSANIVEFNLGNIAPHTQGIVVVIVKVKDTVKPGTNMIFTSVLGYKDYKGTQLANTAYMTVRVGDTDAPLSAAISSSVGMSGILWLIAIVLMIMLGLLAFRLVRMKRKSGPQKEEDIFGLGKVPATVEPVGSNIVFKR